MILNIILVLAGIGILNTLYLSYHSLTKTSVLCLFFPPEWCKTVQTSTYSKFLGLIPNSYLGLGMYSTIFVLVLLFAQGSIIFAPAIALIIFGFLFSLYFLYIQAFVLKAFCTWCVLSAIDFTAMVVLLVVYLATTTV